MDYAEADKIRKKSLSDRIAEKMIEGESFGKSVSKSMSEGTKARVTNIKKKFDPMNIAKFMTGGSNLAPAIVGKLMGRDKKAMQYFTGKTDKKDTASKISPIAQNEGILNKLEDIHGLLVDIRNKRDASKSSEEDVFEKKNLAEKRHKELIDAIKGLTTKEQTATKVKDEDVEDKSIFDTILEAFGLKELGKAAISTIGRLALWAVGPVGGLILGAGTAAALGVIMYKMLTDPSGYDKDPNSPLNKGLKQAESVGGLAGVKDEMEMRKGLPEYTRTLLELQDAEKTFWKDEDGNPQFGTDEQLKGYAARSPEAAEAVEAYKKKRDAVKGIKSKEDKKTSENIQTNVETDVGAAPGTTAAATSESAGATAAVSNAETSSMAPNAAAGGEMTASSMAGKSATQVPSSMSEKSPGSTKATQQSSETAMPMESMPASAAVNNAISENLNMNLPVVPDATTADIINNTTVNTQNKMQQDLSFPMPAVRNMEETFRRMILYSTRVV